MSSSQFARPVTGCMPCSNCCVQVPQDHFYAKENFGSFHKMLNPGLNIVGFDMCGVCIQFKGISNRVQQNEVVVSTKTKDDVFVHVTVAVQQQVMDEHARDAMYKLAKPHDQIESYVADVVRSSVPKMILDDVFDKKDEIAHNIETTLKTQMKTYGFEIKAALVTEINPDKGVQQAMNEINKQRRLRIAAEEEAQAHKIKVVKAAEAEADSKALQGDGIARQRSAIIDGLRLSISKGSQDELTPQKISELLLITQYFDTLKEMSSNAKTSTVFLPHSPGGIGNIAEEIRNGVLQSQAGGAGGAPPPQLRM